jgi:hypothetical protein
VSLMTSSYKAEFLGKLKLDFFNILTGISILDLKEMEEESINALIQTFSSFYDPSEQEELSSLIEDVDLVIFSKFLISTSINKKFQALNYFKSAVENYRSLDK